MRELKDEPILTTTFASAAEFLPDDGSEYFFGESPEQRSTHLSSWKASAKNVTFRQIEEESADGFRFTGESEVYWLRNSRALRAIFAPALKGKTIYLDITGLSHSVWASLLRAAIGSDVTVRVVYVEPDKYIRSSAPVDGQIYDLSSRISGVAPLPGFAVLSSAPESIFVPLLGFEGTRFRHLLEHVQPAVGRVFPVVGSPGFKPWYVFETYAGNKAALIEEAAWQGVRYAPANCPFSCFYLLKEIAASAPDSSLKIAPIGTKPHALGAVLFALDTTTRTELIYDHPIRKPGRSDGSSRLLVYHVGALLDKRSGGIQSAVV